MDKMTKKNAFSAKTLKAGSYSLAICALALVIAVLVNLITSAIPAKYSEIDISGTDLYSLSDYSKQIVKNIDKDVTIYHLATKNGKDKTIASLLDRYAELNKHIKVELRDPEISQIASQYTKDEVYENSLIVVSDARSKVVSVSDIYEYSENAQMYAYSGQNVSPDIFDGESEITSALTFVTSDVLPKVYVLTGHDEYALNATVESKIASQNIELVDLDLLMEKRVPEDCACLMVLGPKADLTKEEREAIEAYLSKGGRMLAATLTAASADGKLSNFDSLLKTYGIQTSDGFVIEGSESSFYYYPNYLLPTMNDHEITSPLISGKFHVFMPMAQSFGLVDNYRSTLNIEPLLSTSDSSFGRVDAENTSIEKAADDIDGPFDVAYAISEEVSDGETRVVVFATPYFMDEQFVSYAGNLNLLLNSMKWMCDLEENISVVSSKSLTTGGSLEVSNSATLLWGMIITVLIPVILIGVGIAIFVRRKKR